MSIHKKIIKAYDILYKYNQNNKFNKKKIEVLFISIYSIFKINTDLTLNLKICLNKLYFTNV